MDKGKLVSIFVLLLSITAFMTEADAGVLKVAPIFNDNMVLQRDREIRIWGKCAPETAVFIGFASRESSVHSDINGFWEILLPAESASAAGRRMTIRSLDETIVLENILVGDVWLTSGQSNMVMKVNSLEQSEREELLSVRDDGIRYTQISQVVEGGKVLAPANPVWESPAEGNNAGWSAVSMYFALRLRRALGIPVGIICCAQGSSNIEAWIGRDFAGAKNLAGHFQKNYPQKNISSHYKNSYMLFENMLSDIIGYSMKGVVWYQGEANAKTGIADDYRYLLPAMIECWREEWRQPDLPFAIVQLPNYRYREKDGNPEESWAIVRDAQRRTSEKMDNVFLAVTIGQGENGDIHPKHKRITGTRIANEVLYGVYGLKNYPVSPRWDKAQKVSGGIQIQFCGNDRLATDRNAGGFEVCDRSGIWHVASARIYKDRISVSCPNCSDAVSVRYAWSNTAEPTVFSRNGVPASPMTMVLD